MTAQESCDNRMGVAVACLFITELPGALDGPIKVLKLGCSWRPEDAFDDIFTFLSDCIGGIPMVNLGSNSREQEEPHPAAHPGAHRPINRSRRSCIQSSACLGGARTLILTTVTRFEMVFWACLGRFWMREN